MKMGKSVESVIKAAVRTLVLDGFCLMGIGLMNIFIPCKTLEMQLVQAGCIVLGFIGTLIGVYKTKQLLYAIYYWGKEEGRL